MKRCWFLLALVALYSSALVGQELDELLADDDVLLADDDEPDLDEESNLVTESGGKLLRIKVFPGRQEIKNRRLWNRDLFSPAARD